jgi:CubicO group peptidase (beta-lactamase class C family)
MEKKKISTDYAAMAEALDEIRTLPGRELSGLAVVVVKKGNVAFKHFSGTRRFGRQMSRETDLPVNENTLWRVASLSKPVTALAVWRLADKGVLDLDADISEYIGFRLRNPYFPDSAITARMLLSHTSSLRDAAFYYPPLTYAITDLLLPGGQYYDDGCHFAATIPGRDTSDVSPGMFYAYCNLGYAILGGAIERLSGMRFDLFMQKEILKPLNIEASYNPNILTDRSFENLSPLYRKCPPETDNWDSSGPWFAQVDDFRGARPKFPVRLPVDSCGGRAGSGEHDDSAEHGGGANDSDFLERYLKLYKLGENGSLFSPQGGLRIRALDLCVLMSELARKPLMAVPAWERDASSSNCDDPKAAVKATGAGLMLTMGPRGKFEMWGHHGDAYGFLGGMFFKSNGDGYVYQIGGVGTNPDLNLGERTNLYIWEEKIRDCIETAFF